MQVHPWDKGGNVLSSVCVLAESQVRLSWNAFILFIEKLFTGSQYPKNIQFTFENRISDAVSTFMTINNARR